MLYLRNREELENALVTKHAAGWSIRALSRHFRMGRNAVRRILRARWVERDGEPDAAPNRQGTLRAARPSKLDPFAGRIGELLEKYPDLTGERVFEILRDEGYTGRISIVRDRLRKIRPRPKRQPVVRFETDPGVQGQMDWSPYTLPFTRDGRKEVLCFSYILGYSRRHYIDFVRRRDFHTLIRRHQDAFDYFGGVPRHCLYDGEKTVLLRWEAGRPVYNPSFVAFATHYRFKPLGCRPGRPKTKGKIERPFQYVETNLLGGRAFADLEDLRAVARWWLAERSDRHVHDTTGRPPLELFLADEQSALQALPLHPYDASEVALRVCGVEGLVEFETNRYSVPYDYVAEILTLKATEGELFVYSPEIDLLARHERLPAGAGRLAENPAHRQAKSVRYGLEPVREAFLRLGEAAEAFLAGLARAFPRNGGFHARLILRLKERYHSEDIHRALQHAALYQAFDGKAVERIVTARAKPRTLESVRNEAAAQSLSQALPEIRQRPLAEYGRLFLPLEDDDEQGSTRGCR